jgi:hypothetical protein
MKRIVMHITLLLSYGTSYAMDYESSRQIMVPRRHSYSEDWPGKSAYRSHFTEQIEGDYALIHQEWSTDDALTHHDLRLSGTIKLPHRNHLQDCLRDHGYHEDFIGRMGLRKLGSAICTPEHVYDIVTEKLEAYGTDVPNKSEVQAAVPSLYRPDILRALLTLHPGALNYLEQKGLLE